MNDSLYRGVFRTQTSKMVRFAKIINFFQPSIIFKNKNKKAPS